MTNVLICNVIGAKVAGWQWVWMQFTADNISAYWQSQPNVTISIMTPLLGATNAG